MQHSLTLRAIFTCLLLVCTSIHLSAQSPGTADGSFGTNGMKSIPYWALELIPQADNGFIAKGFDDAVSNWGMWKYKSSGELDSTYGVNGNLTTPVVNGESFSFLKNGKIAQLSTLVQQQPGNLTDLQIIMRNEDFSIDTSWGNNGAAFMDIAYNDSPFFAETQPDGRLVVYGNVAPSNNTAQQFTLFLCRFTTEGVIDSSFGQYGWFYPEVNQATEYKTQRPEGFIMHPDGSFLIGAAVRRMVPSDKSLFYIARFLPDGNPDITFGNGSPIQEGIGIQTTVMEDLKQDNQGRIIAMGRADYSQLAIARFLPNGSPDLSFSGDGKFMDAYMNPSILAIQPDNKILLAGNEYSPAIDQIRIIRLRENGTFDTGFSGDGKLAFNFAPGTSEQILDLQLQADGKIIFSGVKNETNERYLMRLHSGLIVAAKEPSGIYTQHAQAQPNLVHAQTEITIQYPHLNQPEQIARLVSPNGKVDLIQLTDQGNGLNLMAQIPTGLAPGFYHIVFLSDKNQQVCARFIKL
ncbi:MAG: hypothetical protein SFV22_20535 [Saprospiraceae bacterium]|nr:hypothetical protein [Saprospiraceae bacterium]